MLQVVSFSVLYERIFVLVRCVFMEVLTVKLDWITEARFDYLSEVKTVSDWEGPIFDQAVRVKLARVRKLGLVQQEFSTR